MERGEAMDAEKPISNNKKGDLIIDTPALVLKPYLFPINITSTQTSTGPFPEHVRQRPLFFSV